MTTPNGGLKKATYSMFDGSSLVSGWDILPKGYDAQTIAKKEREEEILAKGPANGFHFVSECLRYKVVRAPVFHARARQ